MESETFTPQPGSELIGTDRHLRAGVTIASALEFRNINHRFDEHQVLDNVSLRVEPGEVLCLLGPSGSGKSTLLRIAAGLELPASGEILIDDQIVTGSKSQVPPEKRNLGLVFQDYALFPHLTILENVKFGLTALARKEAEFQARHVLSCVDMDRFAAKYPHQLSGGEQQRVALARALAPKPGILLMDEPFSGLDSRLRDTVREQTLQLLADTRSTTIIVTHDPLEALRVADHIALMRNGRIIQHGTGEQLYNNPVNLFAARFFSELNVFRTRTSSANGDIVINTPLGTFPVSGIEADEEVHACIRHTDLQLTDTAQTTPIDQHKSGQSGKIVGWLESRRYLGVVELMNIWLEGVDQPLKARVRTGQVAEGAKMVELAVRSCDVHIFPVREEVG